MGHPPWTLLRITLAVLLHSMAAADPALTRNHLVLHCLQHLNGPDDWRDISLAAAGSQAPPTTHHCCDRPW